MKAHLITFISLYLILPFCFAQNFDGFVVTKDDSLFRGYMHILLDAQGRKIEITKDKRKRARIFHAGDLKLYAFKSDTFAILKAFYPFEGEDYLAENIEGRPIISKGRLWLYKVTLPKYGVDIRSVASSNSGGVMVRQSDYETFVIRDRDGNLYGVRREHNDFLKSLEIVLADDTELLELIRKRELRYKDMKIIISIYNSRQ